MTKKNKMLILRMTLPDVFDIAERFQSVETYEGPRNAEMVDGEDTNEAVLQMLNDDRLRMILFCRRSFDQNVLHRAIQAANFISYRFIDSDETAPFVIATTATHEDLLGK